ncbi:hypothetical protein AB6735_24250 [Mucilaginibacter sp. RCC_168]|uniref:hypothetical protein n=1 Tax=Mucilaginibacter sp. RCC_168 TaxID=3239221 RepID=UPI0035234E4C
MILYEPITFDNSPIEFVLIGPFKGKDVILIKSVHAGLDLIGLANFRQKTSEYIPNNNSLLSSLSGPVRQLNMVESGKSFDIEMESDGRRSAYRFAWVGSGHNRDIQRVGGLLDDIISVIKVEINNRDVAEVELLISAIILECSLIDQRRLKTKRTMIAVLISYAIIIVLTVIYYFWWQNLKK